MRMDWYCNRWSVHVPHHSIKTNFRPSSPSRSSSSTVGYSVSQSPRLFMWLFWLSSARLLLSQSWTVTASSLSPPWWPTAPSYSTFRRHFLQTSPECWISSFNHWAMATLPAFSPALLSIDGISIRATSTGGNRENQNFVSLLMNEVPDCTDMVFELLREGKCFPH